MNNLHLVTFKEIPVGGEVPLDNPLEVYKLGLLMQKLCKQESGIGLSAVQVGIPWNFFVIQSENYGKFSEPGKFNYFVNCRYEPAPDSQKIVSLEGCLSLRTPQGGLRRFELERWNRILLTGQRLQVSKDLHFVNLEQEVVEVHQQAIIFQHEIDHSSQVLISEIGKEIFIW